MTRASLLASAVACALIAAGCGSNSAGTAGSPAGGKRSDRLVDFSQKPPWVNGLDVDPVTGDFLLTTNRGFWRIDPETSKVTEIVGRISAGGKSDTVGTFLEIEPIGPHQLIGSGHPDNKNTLPEFLGFFRSDDDGKTWKPVSRVGNADLHKIVLVHDKLYAWDAVLGAMLISEDMGKTFVERFTPRGLVIDFVIDPEDENYILAATDDQIFRSEDQGERWRPVLSSVRSRLSWPAPGVIHRADQDGQVYTSSDRGDTWDLISRVDGEPYKFEETDDPQHLYMALSDGTILETTDGAKSWKAVFTP